MKAKTVTYYKPCYDNHTDIIYLDGTPMIAVTETTKDKYLLDCVRLAKMVGGLPWRIGDGIDPETRYGISKGN